MMDTYEGCWRPIMLVAGFILFIALEPALRVLGLGLFLAVGGASSFYRYWLPEHRRFRTFFVGLGILVINLTGWFLLIAGVLLASDQLKFWATMI
jgi:hypothetical protein